MPVCPSERSFDAAAPAGERAARYLCPSSFVVQSSIGREGDRLLLDGGVYRHSLNLTRLQGFLFGGCAQHLFEQFLYPLWTYNSRHFTKLVE